jgi:mono/diheme cytochrome c family protein
MRLKRLVIGAALAASSWTPPVHAASGGQNNFGPFPDLGQIGNGRRYFLEYGCSQCHGNGATGGGRAPNISTGESLDGVYNAVTNGEPYGGMPSFVNYLTYAQIVDIAAYLNNFPAAGGTVPQPTFVAWWQPHPQW